MTDVTLIGSVQRALHLLEEVAASGAPVPAKALARRVGLNLPTAYHLLRTLVHEGYLQRLDDGYVIGEAFAVMTERRGAANRAWRARPALAALRDEVGAAAYLAVYGEGEISILEIADSPAAPRVDLWVGVQDSAHASALGKGILGRLSAEEQADYLDRHPLAPLTSHTHTDPVSLLRSIRDHGPVTLDEGEYLPGTACVGVPLPGGDLVGTVAVSVPQRKTETILARVPALESAAARIALAITI